ncbi:MAG: hypothetical protein PHD46_02910, partial [Eubacteriales bacterium]|nr:hypothetical protein [Eubacteriales bacterium]
MKKVISAAISVVLIAFAVISGVCADNTYFTLSVTAPESYKSGSTVDIVFTVKDITLSGGMSYASFRVYYDKTKAVPVLKDGFSSEIDSCKTFITNCPDAESWESIGLLNEDEGYYDLTFGTDDVFITKVADNNGDIVFTIPFRIIAQEGEVAFHVPDEYVRGGNRDLTQLEALGSANDVFIYDHTYNSYPDNGSDYDDSHNSQQSSDTDYDNSDNLAEYLILADNATVTIENGFLLGLRDRATVAQIKSMFKGNVNVSGTGTGALVSSAKQSVSIIVRGDVSGDGRIDGKDYLFAKRAFLGTFLLTQAQQKAGCLG